MNTVINQYIFDFALRGQELIRSPAESCRFHVLFVTNQQHPGQDQGITDGSEK
jgi:hypothetical protein